MGFPARVEGQAGGVGGVPGAADGWLVRTPAVRGFPGDPGLPGEPGLTGPGWDCAQPSAWQQSHQVWRGAGVDWVRDPGWLPRQAWPDAARDYRLAGLETGRPAPPEVTHTRPLPVAPRASAGSHARRRRHRAAHPARSRPLAAPRQPNRANTRPAIAAQGSPRGSVGRVTALAASGVAIALAVIITVGLARQPAADPRTPPAVRQGSSGLSVSHRTAGSGPVVDPASPGPPPRAARTSPAWPWRARS